MILPTLGVQVGLRASGFKFQTWATVLFVFNAVSIDWGPGVFRVLSFEFRVSGCRL